MKWFILLIGLCAAAFGSWWGWIGWSIVQVERGWSAVISGSIIFASGLIMVALAAVMARVDAIAALLRSSARRSDASESLVMASSPRSISQNDNAPALSAEDDRKIAQARSIAHVADETGNEILTPEPESANIGTGRGSSLTPGYGATGGLAAATAAVSVTVASAHGLTKSTPGPLASADELPAAAGLLADRYRPADEPDMAELESENEIKAEPNFPPMRNLYSPVIWPDAPIVIERASDDEMSEGEGKSVYVKTVTPSGSQTKESKFDAQADADAPNEGQTGKVAITNQRATLPRIVPLPKWAGRSAIAPAADNLTDESATEPASDLSSEPASEAAIFTTADDEPKAETEVISVYSAPERSKPDNTVDMPPPEMAGRDPAASDTDHGDEADTAQLPEKSEAATPVPSDDWLDELLDDSPTAPHPVAPPDPVSDAKMEAAEETISLAEHKLQPIEPKLTDALNALDLELLDAPAGADIISHQPPLDIATNENYSANAADDIEADGLDSRYPDFEESPAHPIPPQLAVADKAPAERSLLRSYESQGIEYFLYDDGSIDARAESGTLQFSSLDELRKHIEKRRA